MVQVLVQVLKMYPKAALVQHYIIHLRSSPQGDQECLRMSYLGFRGSWGKGSRTSTLNSEAAVEDTNPTCTRSVLANNPCLHLQQLLTGSFVK